MYMRACVVLAQQVAPIVVPVRRPLPHAKARHHSRHLHIVSRGCGTFVAAANGRTDCRRLDAVGHSSTDELLRRACDLGPTLKERALETERLRRIPQATVDDIVA